MRLSYFLSTMALPLVLIVGCEKNIADPVPGGQEVAVRTTSTLSGSGAGLSYGDTVFYLKNQAGNYTVAPVSKPNIPGYFKSIPMGLSLDSVSGNINITLSETGLRYKVFYVSSAGTAVDSVKLVVSGIDYKDAIYEIAATANMYDTAFPIYNARPELPLPCGDENDDDDDNGCVFDETDLNNDGNDDIAGVIQDKLLVDIKKGTIDVEASFHAGVFGSSAPANGLSKDFTFYYRLQDASNRALNKITVRLYHFRRRIDIPQSLLDTLNLRNNISAAVNSMVNNGSGNAAVTQPGNINRVTEYSSRSLDLVSKPKRPPIIIIISQ